MRSGHVRQGHGRFHSWGELMSEWNPKWTERLGRAVPYYTGLSDETLSSVVVSYRECRIRKRDGRERVLAMPNPRLKNVQRLLLRKVLRKLPIHPAAKGFRRGQSTVDHALLHSGKQFVVLVDIEDFFPSTQRWRVAQRLKHLGWSEDRIEQIVRLVCHPDTDGLPQGAPTSPAISNIVNWEMDVRLAGFARKRNLAYSRYADDIAFSPTGHGRVVNPYYVVRVVRTILADYGYLLRPDKIRVLRSDRQQNVTGLVVNRSCNLSRKVRRRLRAAEHRLKRAEPLSAVTEQGDATEMTPEQLHGWQSYVSMISTKVRQANNPGT